ncbi:MAG TPA: hypothetical protein DCS43_06430 [Verrucomicrobia bacterium]|nr:hypothetical protein [Verrucomicrobiota bacterium]
MRYAFVSDIHANLQAWNAVLTAIAIQRVDRILCLGDIVGYGPNPSEVLSSLYRHVDGFCMGNHDAVVCGKLDPQRFNDHARQMIEWTRSRLSGKAATFLGNQPLTLSGPGFRCTHGDFTNPAAFNYIDNSDSAAENWPAVDDPLLFCGHTHVPALFVIGDSGTTHPLKPQDFELEPGKRYIVNPGSTGNPRSGDAQASYCIYDSDAGSVCWYTVPFDLDACRSAIRAAGLNEADTGFLALDPRRRLAAVREEIDFAPARNEAEQAQGVTLVSELTRLSRTARRWKQVAAATAVVSLISIATALGFSLLRPPTVDGPMWLPQEELAYTLPASATGNWLPPFPATTDGRSLPGWRFRFDRPDAATFAIQPDENVGNILSIHVTNATPATIRLESAPVRVQRSGPVRFTLRTRLERPQGFSGFVRFAVEQLGAAEAGVYPVLMRETKEPPPISPLIRFTTDASKIVPAARFVRLVIESEHNGTVSISQPSLTPAE